MRIFAELCSWRGEFFLSFPYCSLIEREEDDDHDIGRVRKNGLQEELEKMVSRKV